MNLYGLIVGIAIVIAINYFESHQNILASKNLNIFVIGTVLSGIIGARAYHVIDQWSYYSINPNLIIATWNGGLGIYGGITGGLFFLLLFSLFYKKNILDLLNFITPILPLSQAIGRIGNYINHENPIWWFETLFCTLLFLIIKKLPRHPTAKYFIGYGILRFISEFFRTDTWQINHTNIAQIISLILIVTGLYLLKKSTTQSDSSH